MSNPLLEKRREENCGLLDQFSPYAKNAEELGGLLNLKPRTIYGWRAGRKITGAMQQLIAFKLQALKASYSKPEGNEGKK